MATGHYNEHGIWIFGEDDEAATASEMLNKLAYSLSDALSRLAPTAPQTIPISEVASLASGWKLASAGGSLVRYGKSRFLEVVLERTGSSIAVGATGDIANRALMTIGTSDVPITRGPLVAGPTGRGVFGYVDPAGLVSLTAVAGANSDIVVGQSISVAAYWAVA